MRGFIAQRPLERRVSPQRPPAGETKAKQRMKRGTANPTEMNNVTSIAEAMRQRNILLYYGVKNFRCDGAEDQRRKYEATSAVVTPPRYKR